MLLVQFTLAGVSRDAIDGAEFATVAQNVLLRRGINIRVEVYAVFEEGGNTV